MRFRLSRYRASLAAVLLAAWPCSATEDPSLATGRNFAPFVLFLQPSLQMSPMPGWMESPAVVRAETATVEIPIPALWVSPTAEFYALTVVFDDCGDGGPAVEWRAADGTTSTISQGLGESGTGLGMNARTVLLPQSLTQEGGVLVVSYYAKFDGLVSMAVRPARQDLLAVLGGGNNPVMVDEALRVFELGEVDGRRPAPVGGDVRRGAVVEAELSAPLQQLDSEMEFVVPVSGTVEGSIIRMDVLGLDPEARIEVRVNSVAIGSLSFPPFRLDDPALVQDPLGRLVVAGWRTGSIFVPARLWMSGDNSLVLVLRRSEVETGAPVFIKNSGLHMRFGTEADTPEPVLPTTSVSEASPLPEIVTTAP
jgi:hypothetical protein